MAPLNEVMEPSDHSIVFKHISVLFIDHW